MGTFMRYEELLKIPSSHKLVLRKTLVEQRKGQDADIYVLEELDANMAVVARYEVRESMSIYPPFKRNVTWKRVNG